MSDDTQFHADKGGKRMIAALRDLADSIETGKSTKDHPMAVVMIHDPDENSLMQLMISNPDASVEHWGCFVKAMLAIVVRDDGPVETAAVH